MRQEIEKYINKTYKPLQEYPWQDAPHHSTFKHTDNKKWFALIMEVPYRTLKIEKDGLVDVINLKNIPELIGGLRKKKGILPAYHMNKNNWITIILDDSLTDATIFELVKKSYLLIKESRIHPMMNGNDSIIIEDIKTNLKVLPDLRHRKSAPL